MRQEDLIEIDEDVSRALMDEELAGFEDAAFDELIEAAVRLHAGDPEGLWEKLTYRAYDPKRILRVLRDHHDADSEIDPMLLMETYMEEYDYPYAYYARFAIGCVVGHNHMRMIRTKGKSYWQTGLGRVEPMKWSLRKLLRNRRST